MNKILDFLRDIYDYFFYAESIQERRFKSEYDLLRLNFIAEHCSLLEDDKSDQLSFKSNIPIEIDNYSHLCRHVINLLHEKNRYAKRLDTDSKFKLLNLARREEILRYSNFECDTTIKRILGETSKLDTWRKETILQLLSKYENVETKEDTNELVKTSLYEAAYLLDGYFDNSYYKSKIAKKTIGFLNRVLVVLLLTILAYSAVLEFGFEPSRQFLLGPFSDLWLVVLFGLLGAAFSTLLNLYKGNKLKNSIIKQIDAVNLTVARLVIGACAGLIVFLILNSDLLTIKGFNDTVNSVNGPRQLNLPMLSLIFVAGFTERLVLNFIEKLSAQAESSSKDQKPPSNDRTLLDLNKNLGQGGQNGTPKVTDPAKTEK
ncbi:MAG TPA: hypothetical protein VF144_15215 [Chitinophagaceae bacterium]